MKTRATFVVFFYSFLAYCHPHSETRCGKNLYKHLFLKGGGGWRLFDGGTYSREPLFNKFSGRLGTYSSGALIQGGGAYSRIYGTL